MKHKWYDAWVDPTTIPLVKHPHDDIISEGGKLKMIEAVIEAQRIIIENAAKKQNPKAIVTVAKEEPILNWEEWMPVESEIEDDYIVYKVLCDYCDEKYHIKYN